MRELAGDFHLNNMFQFGRFCGEQEERGQHRTIERTIRLSGQKSPGEILLYRTAGIESEDMMSFEDVSPFLKNF